MGWFSRFFFIYYNYYLGGSIYGRYFPDESYKLVHDKAGILTTANPKINTNDS